MTDQKMTEDPDSEQIRISLVLSKSCNDRSLEVPADPIAVPSTTRKKGLSAIINHLLDRNISNNDDGNDSDSERSDDDEEKLPAIPFDFLLNNKLLRMSVEAAARREGLSLEQAVEIQYFPARQAPEEEGESESLPEWISAMSSSSDLLWTGNCDGSIRLFSPANEKGSLIQTDVVKAHSGPIKCLSSSTSHDNVDSTIVATGSMDQTLLTHSYETGGKLVLHTVYTGGHTSSINSVRLLCDKSGVTMASGDWDGGLCIWKVPSDTNESAKPREKRRKGSSDANDAVREASPFYCFKAHSNNISGISWSSESSNTIITSSWDHSIKTWDVESQNNILTLNGSKVVTALGRCHNSDVVATGHPDCTVRLWDMRSSSKNEGNVFDNTLRPSHRSWISAVEWSPVDPFVMASTSHDGSVKVWDIRSSVPLHTIKAHAKGSKALCLSFTEKAIFSGGSDCIVKQFRF
uniref:Ribosome biogenesis protein WDR12 homolog n=1 Tax=Chaetoceros debilis TaxID=122233 RepID=A0A7S3Q0R3_9STRA|eukprot:CAMPEP_0194095466 /NCGR_PEP_ID=MMETSP0149-20130528/56843_1 /TAXON_ID=122233 /ORGANISM="Chaetoceros debilis, Strain MM31A-1" /LENGTH=462 /DNA_ID=CAMNT_0038781411 /DNA_START=72 /DNA_END=1460 /DNA_ORIENTATION=+